jgi:uncharacterized protein YlzI (FlbEa/FlbD family)
MNIETVNGKNVYVNPRFVAAIEDNGDGTVDIVVSFHNRDGTYSVRASLDSIVTRINNAKGGA